MPSLIVSTCGTSLLSNEADEAMRRLLITLANAKERDIAEPDRKAIEARVEQRRTVLLYEGNAPRV